MENNSIKPAATLVKKTDLPKTKTAKKQKSTKPTIVQELQTIETKVEKAVVSKINELKTIETKAEEIKLSFLSKIKKFLGI